MNCKDCNYHRTDGTCANKQADYFGLTTEDGCAWHEADWIRVEDRLPDELLEVLVCTKDGHTVGYHVCGRWVLLAYHSPVTHWMPLPELPRD